MINNTEVARSISDLMIDMGARLNSSVELVADNCATEELQQYRRAVAAIMAEMLVGIMNPLYRTRPSLKPAGLD